MGVPNTHGIDDAENQNVALWLGPMTALPKIAKPSLAPLDESQPPQSITNLDTKSFRPESTSRIANITILHQQPYGLSWFRFLMFMLVLVLWSLPGILLSHFNDDFDASLVAGIGNLTGHLAMSALFWTVIGVASEIILPSARRRRSLLVRVVVAGLTILIALGVLATAMLVIVRGALPLSRGRQYKESGLEGWAAPHV